MLTQHGLGAAARAIAELLSGGSAEVTDGTQTARVPLASVTAAGATVTATATFPAETANFDWRTRRLRDSDGNVVDESSGDYGRKAATSIWTLDTEIPLEAAE